MTKMDMSRVLKALRDNGFKITIGLKDLWKYYITYPDGNTGEKEGFKSYEDAVYEAISLASKYKIRINKNNYGKR